jgi:tetratricopeptide (TPR) repeat protein
VRRAKLHLRIAEALEAAPSSPSARALADLAHHFTAAAPVGGRERAVEYNLLAAKAAAAALAFDEAVAQLRTALELGIDDKRREATIRLELGAACLRAGQSLESIEAYHEGADIARRVGDGEAFARAAVGLEKACWPPQITDADAVELLEEACVAATPAPTPPSATATGRPMARTDPKARIRTTMANARPMSSDSGGS